MKYQRKTLVGLLAIGMMSLPDTVLAVYNLSIGNGPDLINNTYLNANSLADSLVFSDISLQADNSISIVDPIDLSSTLVLGPTLYGLTLQSALVNIDNLIVMGPGNFSIKAPIVNLVATITDTSAVPLGGTRISGTATQVNVTSTNASIQQG
ncbi:MAG: hypothetical protein K8F26_01785, partial [Thiobacillus sp.]|nr:hypothetical protein [Thiobacillus sp.]